MNASLEVELSSTEAIALAPRLHAITLLGDEPDSFFAVTASRLRISSANIYSYNNRAKSTSHGRTDDSIDHDKDKQRQSQGSVPMYAAVFLPATLTDSAMEGCHDFITNDGSSKLSKRVLAMAHQFLAENFSVKGILAVRNESHAPADVVLVDLSHTPISLMDELLQTTNGQVIHAGPELILKSIMIHNLHFIVKDSKPSALTVQSSSSSSPSNENHPYAMEAAEWHGRRAQLEIPSCPVCLHRIDPMRIGLPKPYKRQVCSKFCTPPTLMAVPRGTSRLENGIACPHQRLLLPWPRPSHCLVCRKIDQYWQAQANGSDDALLCNVCSMQQTLWVCMTCAFLGCGRYSNKHAADHFVDSGHPFSLELATLRIWDYVTGGFIQRTDLLECPSALPLLQPWVAASHPRPMAAAALSSLQVSATTEKTPKKATMIGEEYEALLQSALEEQAQHYERELAHLKTQLTAEQVDRSAMTSTELAEVEILQAEITSLLSQIDCVSRELLDAQAQEAGQRATSQTLLRHQQMAQDILTKLDEETARERQEGRTQVEELEQQIADLTANQRMRDQFTQNQELQQAQIWGMASTSPAATATPSRGKKGRQQRRVRR